MATADERDPVMDRLLARTLRDAPVPGDACPDAEVLSVWVEGALPAGEAAAVESHLGSCARCQAVLATFAKTAPDPSTLAPVSGAVGWRLRWLMPAAGVTVALIAYVASRPAPDPVPDAVQSSVEVSPNAAARGGAGENAANAPPEIDQLRQFEARDQSVEKLEQAPPLAAPQERGTVTGATPRAPEVAPPAGALAARTLSLASGLEIVSSAVGERWQITADGVVSRSGDGGATWQPAGQVSDGIRAGAAPATAVCWLAGRDGAVWLTTDGIAFRRLPFPERVPLARVLAVSATEATVITVDGRSFRTSDQGTTWQPSPNP